MEAKIRILLVDDHAVLRAGLRMLLDAEEDMTVVGEAPDVPGALAQLEALNPDVALVDISMPEVSGLDGLRAMKAAAPDSMFLILTMHNDEGYLRRALSAGASGYVLKQSADQELLSAIRVVSQGGTFLHNSHKSILFEAIEPRSIAVGSPPAHQEEYERLSPREKEILRLIAMGYTNRQAAEELFLSEKTIETYKSRVMNKLNLHSRIELVRFALQRGIIQD